MKAPEFVDVLMVGTYLERRRYFQAHYVLGGLLFATAFVPPLAVVLILMALISSNGHYWGLVIGVICGMWILASLLVGWSMRRQGRRLDL